MSLLSLDRLNVAVGDTCIIKNLSLAINAGSIHALMGPNGSGKSTLAHTIIGYPGYVVQQGSIIFNGTDITALSIDKRARAGILLSFQHPQEIPGVSTLHFLREAHRALTGMQMELADFTQEVMRLMDIVSMDHALLYRNVNEGFSGGEKKRFEMLQVLLFKPSLVIFDEIDSGLDIDALKSVARGIAYARENNPAMGMMLITHYQRIMNYVIPDSVHVMVHGSLVQSGGMNIVEDLERNGYEQYVEQYVSGTDAVAP